MPSVRNIIEGIDCSNRHDPVSQTPKRQSTALTLVTKNRSVTYFFIVEPSSCVLHISLRRTDKDRMRVRGSLHDQHIFHFLSLIVIPVFVHRFCGSLLGIVAALVSICLTQAVVVGKWAALVEDGNLFQDLAEVGIRLLGSLSQGLHRPILILPEAIENEIQKLILRDTSRLEDFGLLGLENRGSIFL